jgi:hypothetical protein
MWQILEGPSSSGGIFTPEAIILSLLLAFALGPGVGLLFYSQRFVLFKILCPITDSNHRRNSDGYGSHR